MLKVYENGYKTPKTRKGKPDAVMATSTERLQATTNNQRTHQKQQHEIHIQKE